MKKILFTIILIIALLFLYGRYIEPKTIKIHEYTIKSENIREKFEELKIVQFSDLLYNKDEKKLKKLEKIINDQKPDIIIFSGNLFGRLFSYKDKDYNKLKEFLNDLDANLYKYAVIGDNDQKYLDKYKDILYESDFNLLNNENHLLFYKEITPINIVGLTNTNDISHLFNTEVETDFNLVISSKPDLIKDLEIYNINMMVSGSSLGGIVNIPFYGGLIKRKGASTYINNYYKVNNTDFYISNGIGYDDFEFRLFNAPSINVYRFSKIEN